MEAKDKLIVALDVESIERAMELVDELSSEVELFKIGIAPFTDFGYTILEKLQTLGKKVFLDLKVHDIPNTVANAARAAVKKDIFMMNFHCLGGLRMLQAAVKGTDEGCRGSDRQEPLLLGVTILTSMAKEDMESLGIAGEVQDKVLELAQLAKKAGLDGVVASAQEARLIKERIGKDFIVVTPGIRPEWAQTEDQKRTLTPKEAIAEGADYIVVGRPIIEAENPREAAKRIIKEIGE